MLLSDYLKHNAVFEECTNLSQHFIDTLPGTLPNLGFFARILWATCYWGAFEFFLNFPQSARAELRRGEFPVILQHVDHLSSPVVFAGTALPPSASRILNVIKPMQGQFKYRDSVRIDDIESIVMRVDDRGPVHGTDRWLSADATEFRRNNKRGLCCLSIEPKGCGFLIAFIARRSHLGHTAAKDLADDAVSCFVGLRTTEGAAVVLPTVKAEAGSSPVIPQLWQ